jgi:hypothetical protein
MPKKIFSVFLFSAIMTALLMPIQAFHTPALAVPSEPEFWAVIIGVTEYQCPLCMFDKEWNVYPVGVKHPDDSARDLALQLSPIAGDDHIKLVLNDEATNAGIYYAVKISKRNTL